MDLRIRRKPGAIVLVPLGEHSWGCARVLQEPLVEFYDGVTTTSDVKVGPEDLKGMRVIFKIDVMNSAITNGRWRIIGQADLTEDEKQHIEKFFKEDPISGKLSIYWEDPKTGQVLEAPASIEECRSLERASVWDAEHAAAPRAV